MRPIWSFLITKTKKTISWSTETRSPNPIPNTFFWSNEKLQFVWPIFNQNFHCDKSRRFWQQNYLTPNIEMISKVEHTRSAYTLCVWSEYTAPYGQRPFSIEKYEFINEIMLGSARYTSQRRRHNNNTELSRYYLLAKKICWCIEISTFRLYKWNNTPDHLKRNTIAMRVSIIADYRWLAQKAQKDWLWSALSIANTNSHTERASRFDRHLFQWTAPCPCPG